MAASGKPAAVLCLLMMKSWRSHCGCREEALAKTFRYYRAQVEQTSYRCGSFLRNGRWQPRHRQRHCSPYLSAAVDEQGLRRRDFVRLYVQHM